MNKVELIPFVTSIGSYRVCVDDEWVASIHTCCGENSELCATMMCTDEVMNNLRGGMAEAYQWAMRTYRKHLNGVGRPN